MFRHKVQAGIYLIKNKMTGECYVGQSKDIRKRWQSHLAHLRQRRHNNDGMQCAYDEYGPNIFEFEIIERVGCKQNNLRNILLDRERYWMKKLRPQYNLIHPQDDELEEDAFHDRATEFIPLGKTYKPPDWHAWVYGGEKSPCITGEKPTRKQQNPK